MNQSMVISIHSSSSEEEDYQELMTNTRMNNDNILNHHV